jgi:hypothetical protein
VVQVEVVVPLFNQQFLLQVQEEQEVETQVVQEQLVLQLLEVETQELTPVVVVAVVHT